MDTLVLNKDGEVLSLLPLSTIMWQTSIKLFVLNKIHVLEYYQNWEVHSPSTTLKVPSVVISKYFVRWPRNIKYSRANVMLRDKYFCQLCMEKFDLTNLTIDHVVPRSKGGKTTWTNVVTCCRRCNFHKGDDETIIPSKAPQKPTYYELVKARQDFTLSIRDGVWKNYINWPEEHLILRKPKQDQDPLDLDDDLEQHISKSIMRSRG
jgi:5-methylcytosine-specific restriction endonuclease McrA